MIIKEDKTLHPPPAAQIYPLTPPRSRANLTNSLSKRQKPEAYFPMYVSYGCRLVAKEAVSLATVKQGLPRQAGETGGAQRQEEGGEQEERREGGAARQPGMKIHVINHLALGRPSLQGHPTQGRWGSLGVPLKRSLSQQEVGVCRSSDGSPPQGGAVGPGEGTFLHLCRSVCPPRVPAAPGAEWTGCAPRPLCQPIPCPSRPGPLCNLTDLTAALSWTFLVTERRWGSPLHISARRLIWGPMGGSPTPCPVYLV